MDALQVITWVVGIAAVVIAVVAAVIAVRSRRG